MKVLPPTPESISEAAAALGRGEVAAYPTETVYGLAVDPFSLNALNTLFQVKERQESQAVLLIVANESQLEELVMNIPPQARKCMERFWPGPLSLLLDPRPGLPAPLLGAEGKVCVRQSSHPVATQLCHAFGHPITSTSANRSGQPPARSAHEIMLDGLALVLDGGALPPGPPSTLFDPVERRVLRAGPIEFPELEQALTGFN